MDAVIELEISAGPTAGSYVVRVRDSLAGGTPSATIELDADGVVADLANIESGILASSVSARRVVSPHESAVQRIGVDLFDRIFAGRIGEAYRASAAVAAERGVASQLLLRLTAPELAALPWETLYDTDAGRYVSRKEPLVRRVPTSSSIRQGPIRAPLRILGMVSAPRGLQMLDVEAERERLESALAEHTRDGRVELVWLEDTSWGGLHNMLLRETWHVLHFIGHGGYDPVTDEGLIALVGPDGRADFVPASSFADLLNEASTAPRLVVLNSCQSGATGTADLFSGTAASLVHSGINAVVAMQFAVSDYAALAFARGFYVALASGRRIEDAVRSGRIGILGISRETLEWITPVLYLGGDDTRLLDPAALSAPPVAGAAAPTPMLASPVPPPRDDPAGTAPPEDRLEPPDDVSAERGLDTAEGPTITAGPTAASVTAGAPDALVASHPQPGPATRPAPAATATTTTRPPTAPPTASRPRIGSSGTPPFDASRPPRRRGPVILAAVAVGVLLLGGGTWALLAAPNPGGGDGGSGTAGPAEPVVIQTQVRGALDWTPTGVQCTTDAQLEISASGTVLPGVTNSASGVDPNGSPDPQLSVYNVPGLPDAPHSGLIGRVGDGDPFIVGADYSQGCPGTGELFLGINDTGVVNNGGAFDVTMTTTAETSSVGTGSVALPAVTADVQAGQQWTAVNAACEAGDVLEITATGQAFHNEFESSAVSPDGLVLPDGSPDAFYFEYNLEGLPDTATASLVGSLDQQQPLFGVGSGTAYTCERTGALYLGINDANLAGNHGAWQASVVRIVNPTLD